MKSKYVMISGLAFNEESDMEKLKKYASKGWILEDIIGGFFYKLRKSKPQDIVYTLDYQIDASEEYFNIFKESGWKLVVSVENKMHIFSSKVGAKPIYSDSETEIDKYIIMKNIMKKGTIYSLIIAVLLISLLVFSIINIRSISLIILGLLIINIFMFVSNLMSYLMYNLRIKQIKKYCKYKSEEIYNKNLWKLFAFAGTMFLVLGIGNLIEKKYLAVFYIVLGSNNIYSSLKYYKKNKKSL